MLMPDHRRFYFHMSCIIIRNIDRESMLCFQQVFVKSSNGRRVTLDRLLRQPKGILLCLKFSYAVLSLRQYANKLEQAILTVLRPVPKV